MIDLLLPYIENKSPRILPAWNEYVQNLETFQSILQKRFILNTDYETSGIALLRYILSCVDWNYMAHQKSDFDRYTFYLRFVQEDLENTFEHTTTGFKFHNCFTSKNFGKIKEFIIPVEDMSITKKLPLDKDWSYWKNIKPVRYLMHDSKEFTQYIEADKVKFFYIPPTYVTITIDVIALVFKYWKYMTSAPEEKEWTRKDQRRFIHKYVLSSFFEDLTDIFLINQIHTVSEIEDETELLSLTAKNETRDMMYGYIGSRYNEACRILYKEFLRVKSGQTRPSMLLSSPLLSKKKSLYSFSSTIINELDIPQMRQYQFYRILRDQHLFFIFLNMFEFRKMENVYKTIQRIVGPKIRKFIRDKVWLYIKDDILRTYIENNLITIETKLYHF